MSKPKDILGVVSGVLLVASSAMHSFLGWPQLRGELVKANAPTDLIMGLGIIALRAFVVPGVLMAIGAWQPESA